MENSKENAYGYVRVSTEGQAKQGYSLDEQCAEIEKFCLDNNLNLVRLFSDEGVSGAKADENEMCIEREGLVDMLASLKTREASYIVVLNTSRLWRSDLVKILVHRELKKYGVDVKAVDRPGYSIYTKNPNEILVNGMFELLDVYERLEITLKMKRGRMQKAKSGGYAGAEHLTDIPAYMVEKHCTLMRKRRKQSGGYFTSGNYSRLFTPKVMYLYEYGRIQRKERGRLQPNVSKTYS